MRNIGGGGGQLRMDQHMKPGLGQVYSAGTRLFSGNDLLKRCILNLIREVTTKLPRTFSKVKRIENQPIMHKRIKLNIESLNTHRKKHWNRKQNDEWLSVILQ